MWCAWILNSDIKCKNVRIESLADLASTRPRSYCAIRSAFIGLFNNAIDIHWQRNGRYPARDHDQGWNHGYLGSAARVFDPRSLSSGSGAKYSSLRLKNVLHIDRMK